MKKIFLLIIFSVVFFTVNAAEKAYAFFYSFNQKSATGFIDLAGNLPPVKPTGKWEMRKNTIYLDGKTGRIPLPGTQKVSLVNKTLFALVKFYDAGNKVGSLDSSDGLFSRGGDLLTGRDRWQGFYCNYREVRSSGPKITPNKFMLLAINFIPEKAGKIKLELFIDGKRINWPKPAVPKIAENKAMLEFGCGRGKEWYFHGEVAMIGMKNTIMTAPEQLKFISEQLSGKVKNLNGVDKDFTVDFF